MGKLKKAKKFKKNRLSQKVDHSKHVKKHAQLNGKPGKRSSAATAEDSSNAAAPSKFGVPTQPDLAILNEPGFEKYLSDSEAGSAESDSASDDELAAEEEAAYLAGNDDMDDEDDLDLGGGDDSDASDDETRLPQSKKVSPASLTREVVREWAQTIDKSPGVVKQVIRAFAAEDTIADMAVYGELLKLALGPLPQALRRTLPLTENKTPVQSKRFAGLSGSLKLYAQSLTQMLKNGTNKRVRQVLAATQKTLPYFLSLRKLVKELVKALVSIITNPEVEDQIKMETFSIVREACSLYPNALLELFLKTNYESLVRLCSNTNSHTLPTINLAKNLFAVLYSSDPTAGYQTAFQQVRTLALHLKAALDKSKNPDSALNVIYTWQYVQSLDFFSRVISVAADESGRNSPLLQLIHPLVQVTLRVTTLVPSSAFFPLRFYLVRSLIRLSRHTGVYIPLAPGLVEVLSSSALNKRGKKSSLKQFDFDLNIRVPASYVDTAVYQNGLSDELVDVFAESLVLYSKSIAFPELAGPVIVALKRFVKRSSNGRLNRQLQSLVERLQANSDYVAKARANVDFGPRDKERVAAFLKEEDWEKTPLGSFVVVRRKVREERQRLLQDAKGDNDDEDVEGLSGLEDNAGEDEESALSDSD